MIKNYLELNNNQKFFLKTADRTYYPKLFFESEGLNILNQFADENFLVIPKTLAIEKSQHGSILLMPWLNLEIGNQRKLGLAQILLQGSEEKISKQIDQY